MKLPLKLLLPTVAGLLPFFGCAHNTVTGTTAAIISTTPPISDSCKDNPNVFVEYAPPMPTFPGGNMALMKYIRDNTRYPAEALQAGISGVVVVQFTVEADGSITNATILTSPNKSLSDEALRVVHNMPDWIPGEENGLPVPVRYCIPVVFQLDNSAPTAPKTTDAQ